MVKVVVLDPGHEKYPDVGSVEYDGETENKFTLTMCHLVKEELGAYECDVVLTHEGDGVVPDGDLANELWARSNVANKVGASLFLSIHHNAGPQAARGAELYIRTEQLSSTGELVWLNAVGNNSDPVSFRLATIMQPIIRDALASVGIPWRGAPNQIMSAKFGVLGPAKCPKMLLETHFGTNEDEDNIMDNPDNQRIVAKGIAKAIATGLQLPEKVAPRDPLAVTVLVDGVEIDASAKLVDDAHVDGKLAPVLRMIGCTVTFDSKSMTLNVNTNGKYKKV